MMEPAHALESKFKRPSAVLEYDIATPGGQEATQNEEADSALRESWITATPRESGRFLWSEEHAGYGGAREHANEDQAERNPPPSRNTGASVISSGKGTPKEGGGADTHNDRLTRLVEELMQKIDRIEHWHNDQGDKGQLPPSLPNAYSPPAS